MINTKSAVWAAMQDHQRLATALDALRRAELVVEELANEVIGLQRDAYHNEAVIEDLRAQLASAEAAEERLRDRAQEAEAQRNQYLERLHSEKHPLYLALMSLTEVNWSAVCDELGEVDDEIHAGKKIMAIKVLRKWSGLGLKQSKDIVDKRTEELRGE
jgi:chromosome segregation ATPase